MQSLKEMIILPMMYPEVFRQFQIQPPKGVLFHGPPGTLLYTTTTTVFNVFFIFKELEKLF